MVLVLSLPSSQSPQTSLETAGGKFASLTWVASWRSLSVVPNSCLHRDGYVLEPGRKEDCVEISRQLEV
jgi:hypothetical protein